MAISSQASQTMHGAKLRQYFFFQAAQFHAFLMASQGPKGLLLLARDQEVTGCRGNRKGVLAPRNYAVRVGLPPYFRGVNFLAIDLQGYPLFRASFYRMTMRKAFA
jgi:hypothetical protein